MGDYVVEGCNIINLPDAAYRLDKFFHRLTKVCEMYTTSLSGILVMGPDRVDMNGCRLLTKSISGFKSQLRDACRQHGISVEGQVIMDWGHVHVSNATIRGGSSMNEDGPNYEEDTEKEPVIEQERMSKPVSKKELNAIKTAIDRSEQAQHRINTLRTSMDMHLRLLGAAIQTQNTPLIDRYKTNLVKIRKGLLELEYFDMGGIK